MTITYENEIVILRCTLKYVLVVFHGNARSTIYISVQESIAIGRR